MRKTFLEPELEVVRFGTEDIITTSFVNDGGTEGNIGGGEDTDEWGPETPQLKLFSLDEKHPWQIIKICQGCFYKIICSER